MRLSLTLALTAVMVLTACGSMRESRLNPLNWFGGSREAQADEFGIEAPCELLDGLIYQDGHLAGAALQGESGRRLVRASAGLAFSVGPAATVPPALPALRDASVALVGRRAGRFAKIELLAPGRP